MSDYAKELAKRWHTNGLEFGDSYDFDAAIEGAVTEALARCEEVCRTSVNLTEAYGRIRALGAKP